MAKGCYLSTLELHELDEACAPFLSAFGTHPYLVGSASQRPDFRDVATPPRGRHGRRRHLRPVQRLTGLIHVRNWEKFQHPDVVKNKQRGPAWIKLYTQLHDDPAYLALTPQQRALLLGIWIEYAKTRREIPVSTAWLSRRLAMRVTKDMLAALNHAGYIEYRLESVKTTVTTSSSLEEKREDKRLEKKATSTRLDVTQPDELDQRRQQRAGLEVNGQPLGSVAQFLQDETA